MRQSFRHGFFAAATALHTALLPAQADPIKVSDFEWKNRLLIACDLRRPSYATDWPTRLGEIMRADPENTRKLRIGLLGSDGWVMYAPSETNPTQSVPMIEEGCQQSDCGDRFYRPDHQLMIERIGCDTERESVALIGLDGRVKKIWQDTAPSRDEVFGWIDAMPMRAYELARQSESD